MNNIEVKILHKSLEKVYISDLDIIETVNNSLKTLKPNLTSKLEIEIIFVDKKEIQDLNREHRQIDAPTDVLSFPQDQIKESLVNILGSIVICQGKVQEKDEEMVDVIKHGLLHLLGYDHETDEQKWQESANKINCNL